jgi:hypothetical protein
MQPLLYLDDTLVCRKRDNQTLSKVKASLVVGKAVEELWKLAYQDKGSSLIALAAQRHSDLPAIYFSNLFRSDQALGRCLVVVYLYDFTLAWRIATAVVDCLTGRPWFLQILRVDFQGSSGHPGSHDLVLTTSTVQRSELRNGATGYVYSLELKCRQVGSPIAFNWAETLATEARPFWEAEKAQGAHLWGGRILILAQLGKPCHTEDGAGLFSLHALVLYSGSTHWEKLFGWDSFDLPASIMGANHAQLQPRRHQRLQQQPAEAAPAAALPDPPDPGPAPAPGPPPPPAPPAAAAVPSREDQLDAVLNDAGYTSFSSAPTWLRLGTVLKHLPKGNPRTAHRYVEQGEGNVTWLLGGTAPRKGIDWDHMRGDKGGGDKKTGHGPIHVKKAFLKRVYFARYAKQP